MEAKAVLVTGIGGNVGQGILRNIQSLNLPIRIVGVDIAAFTQGVFCVIKPTQFRILTSEISFLQ